jgi:cyanophycinase
VLVAVGGAEDKLGRRTVLRRFLTLAGGPSARIVVVPTASALGPEVFDLYASVFTALGAAEVVELRPGSRAEANAGGWSELDRATGIYLTGGNQLKLSAIVTGTAFHAALRAAYARGAVIGGTSAGASALSEHMVAFGTGGATPKQRMSQLAAGLGLLPGTVIDQHFDQRNRYGRLVSLVAQSPSLLGIGVDEDTAAVVHGDRVLEVAGRGAVFVVDGSTAVTNAHEALRTAPLMVSGVVLHTLPAGARFDLVERRLIDAGQVAADADSTPEPAQLAADRRAARSLAARIAAEGADDTTPRRNQRRRARRSLSHSEDSGDDHDHEGDEDGDGHDGDGHDGDGHDGDEKEQR